jgi:hypothetical protein
VKPVIYHPEASAEFDAAAERYESLSAGLGGSFIDEVETIVARIEESPAQFPVWPFNPRFQKAVLPETFPSSCYFGSRTTASGSLPSLTALAGLGIGRVASEHLPKRI